MSDNKNSTPEGKDVDRIRDIIFGPQMRDFEHRFETMKRDFDRLQQDLDRLTEQTSNQDSEQGKKLQALRKEMREADDHIRDEVRQTAQTLGNDKVDRLALGELFIELGNHLKTGGSLADLLKDLAE